MKTKLYLILYYLLQVVTFTSMFYFYTLMKNDNVLYSFKNIIYMSIILNAIFILIFTILLIIKRKFTGNIIFPICYLLFFTGVITLSLIYNNYVLISFMHFGYFYKFILFALMLLNIYTLLGIKNK